MNEDTKQLPDGWLLCDGSEISADAYRDLVDRLNEVLENKSASPKKCYE